MSLSTESIDLTLSPQELAATIEALYDTTLKRLRWTLDPERHHWRRLDWLIVQDVVNDLVQAYTKAMMVFREKVGDRAYVGEDGGFIDTFTIPEVVWDALSAVTVADGWDDLPVHRQSHGCELCRALVKGV